MEMRERLVLAETTGSILWFFMDAFWMLEISFIARALILPTLLINLLVFRYTDKKLTDFSITMAMNSWLAMNIFWMLGDLDKTQSLLPAAKVMFGIGMIFLVIAAIKAALDQKPLSKALSRFRRLRIHR